MNQHQDDTRREQGISAMRGVRKVNNPFRWRKAATETTYLLCNFKYTYVPTSTDDRMAA